MKLLYVSRGYTTHDRRFLEAFVQAGYVVHFLPLEKHALDRRALPSGVESVACSGTGFLGLRRILKKISPDIVLAGPVQTSAFQIAMTGFKRLVAMSWGSDMLVDADTNFFMKWKTRFVLRNSVGVFGDCDAVRKKIWEYSDVPNEKIITFPWGIDLKDFRPDIPAADFRKKLGWEKNSVFISTRSWEPIYAIDVLVRGFALAHQKNPELRLLLLGDGSQASMIHALIAELRLSDSVHCGGRIGYDELPGYFTASDVYVSSTLSDGTSISMLEAMACGLPVIVTKAYGNLEWVTQGLNGWLVPPSDSAALGTAMIEAAHDPKKRKEMGAYNICLALERADWNKNFPKLLRFFDEVAVL